MNKKKKRILIIALALTLLLYTFSIIMYSDSYGGTLLHESSQSKEIDYKSYDPYVLTIKDGRTKWRTLGWPKSKILEIMRSGDGSYGHSIELDILGADFSQTETEWTTDGIEIRFDSNHVLTIPKRAFIGGRKV